MASAPAHRVLKDRRTKNLVKRLRPGDIALIDHADLDTTAARALVEARISAVVNAARCITGRYPNRGPSVLLEAGIPILDAVGEEAFAQAGEVSPENGLRRSGSRRCWSPRALT
jgi:uncharacterized membrane-anchored protein